MPLTDQDRQALIKVELDLYDQCIDEAEYAAASQRLWSLTVNRLYYACYHLARALLLKEGLFCKTHAGTLSSFSLTCVNSGKVSVEQGKLLKQLFDLRQRGEYDGVIKIPPERVDSLFCQVRDFSLKLHQIISAD